MVSSCANSDADAVRCDVQVGVPVREVVSELAPGQEYVGSRLSIRGGWTSSGIVE
jgi:hypothetical protein